MKKIYLVAFSFFVVSGLLSQVALKNYAKKYEITRENMSPMTPLRYEGNNHHIGMRVVLLEEDFEGIADPYPAVLPAAWTTTDVLKTNGTSTSSDDFNGPAFDIQNSTTAVAGGYWPVVETGTGNLFAGANDDADPCDCVMTEVYLEVPPIDFSSAAYPATTFDIYHDANFGGGDAFVSVSSDGGANWTNIDYPLGTDGFLPIEEGNWQTIVLTLFDYAGQSDVRIRFNWSDGDSWASGFAVDNVVVGDLEQYSLTLDKTVFGDWTQESFGLGFWDYSVIPLSQASPVHATGIVSNTGFNDLTNVNVAIDVLQGVTSVSTATGLIPTDVLVSLTKDTIGVVSDYVPDVIGDYTIMATTTSDATETDLTDNVAMAHFEMSECTYARDMGAAQAFMAINSGGDYAGNLFDIYSTEEFMQIQFAVGAGSVTGASLSGFVFDWLGFDANGDPVFEFVEGSETEEHTILEDDLNGVGEAIWTCLPFVDPLILEEGHIYLAVVASSDTLRVPVSGSNVWVTSWMFSDNSYGATSGVPMVRLIGNCDETCIVGVREEAKSSASLNQNIPNPASISTNISYVLQGSSKVVLTIRDVAGHLVNQIELGNKSIGKHNYQLDVDGYAPGLYTYTINAGTTNVTRKMIVE